MVRLYRFAGVGDEIIERHVREVARGSIECQIAAALDETPPNRATDGELRPARPEEPAGAPALPMN